MLENFAHTNYSVFKLKIDINHEQRKSSQGGVFRFILLGYYRRHLSRPSSLACPLKVTGILFNANECEE